MCIMPTEKFILTINTDSLTEESPIDTVVQPEKTFLNPKFNQIYPKNCRISALFFGLQNPQKYLSVYG